MEGFKYVSVMSGTIFDSVLTLPLLAFLPHLRT